MLLCLKLLVMLTLFIYNDKICFLKKDTDFVSILMDCLVVFLKKGFAFV